VRNFVKVTKSTALECKDVAAALAIGCEEQGDLFGVRFEVIADDDEVGTGDEGIGHLLRLTDAATDDERQVNSLADSTDNRLWDRLVSTAAGFEVDEAFAKEHGCAGKTDGFIGVLRGYRLCAGEALGCALAAAVHEDISHRNRLNARGGDSIGTQDLLVDKESRITTVHEREEKKGIGFRCELRGAAGEEDDGRGARAVDSANDGSGVGGCGAADEVEVETLTDGRGGELVGVNEADEHLTACIGTVNNMI